MPSSFLLELAVAGRENEDSPRTLVVPLPFFLAAVARLSLIVVYVTYPITPNTGTIAIRKSRLN